MLRRHRIKVLLILFLAMAGGTRYVTLVPRIPPPVTVSVRTVEQENDSKRVIVSFVRCDADTHFDSKQFYQLREGGRWQSPQSIPVAQLDCLTDLRSNSEMVLELPLQTQACRFVLQYEVFGPSKSRPYCQVYGFLSRNGIMKAYPAFSRTVLNWVATKRNRQSMTCEVEIPAAVAVIAH